MGMQLTGTTGKFSLLDTGGAGKFVLESSIIAGGSMLFAGTSTSNLSIANDVDFRVGTEDFTIEWWQYQTDNNAFPRIFQMGSFPSANIGVSIEGGIFYFWANGSATFGRSITPYKNIWVHFAVTRQGTNLRMFKNGTQVGTAVFNNANITNATNLIRIGNESTTSAGASFGGNITNFHWVTGTAKYTDNFAVPTTPTSPIANSKLLLQAITAQTVVTDTLGLKTVVNNNVTWSSLTPFTV
jgi:hypothetical protein